MPDKSTKKATHSPVIKTERLILRFPVEADSVKFTAFDERNMEHLSPWRSTTGESKKDHTSQIIQWNQEFKEGKSLNLSLSPELYQGILHKDMGAIGRVQNF